MHPIELDANLKLAKTHLRSGRLEQDEALYVRCLKAEPRCPEALHFLGMAALRRGRVNEAVKLVCKSIELDPSRADYHNNLATIFGRLNRHPEALGAAQRAIDLRFASPEAHSNKACALERLERFDEAVASYRQALELAPNLVDALAHLGNLLSRLDRHDEALSLLRRCADLCPRDPQSRKLLGNALRRAGRPLEAVTAYRMSIELNPRDADAHNNLGAALQESGKAQDALAVLRTALSINPDHTDAHWNLGLAQLSLGQWHDGWVNYEWRRHLREDAGQNRNFPQPVWQGSPPDGMHLLVLCEQGLGDSIQFIRYVPLLVGKGARVTVECQPRLLPLLKSMETENIKILARGEPLPTFDMHARLLTIPHILGSTPDNVPNAVPYLSIEEHRIARAAELLERADKETGRQGDKEMRPGTLRVGIAWQGNTAHKGDRFRSIALSMFRGLAEVEGVRLVSLQKGHGAEQVEENGGMNVVRCSDPTDTTAEALLETAAVITNLDLVISVDSAIAHLAGALGVAVWVAMPLAADWRWLVEREDTPWYPTMRLFRQREA